MMESQDKDMALFFHKIRLILITLTSLTMIFLTERGTFLHVLWECIVIALEIWLISVFLSHLKCENL
jgi:hypothetical protein